MKTAWLKLWTQPSLFWGLTAVLIVSFSVVTLVITAQEIQRPVRLAGLPYAQSTTCVTCHPGQYETWHNTYHRTMTQRAGPESVVGDFDDAHYTYQGVTSRFWREDGRYYIETLAQTGEMESFEVVMTVGSRRIQQYITKMADRHIRLPLAWNIEEGRWLHLNGGFLHPDGTDFNNHTALWDANCIFCHNVRAQPGYNYDSQTFASEVEELGIACEACHGPAEEHIQRNRNPLRRYFLYIGETDPTLYNPEELSETRQIQLCGHCHGQRLPNPPERIEQYVTTGDPFTVGDNLNEYTTPIFIDTQLEGVDLSLRFWADGTPRLTAYEYQGLLLSTEHEGSGLTCTSCHNMHGGDPKGMIDPEMRGMLACTQCHTEIEADIPSHTKHNATSDGSSCYACHMPDTVYGVLHIHPTHHLENPEPARAWRYEMPEACTVCHTNQTAPWAAETMAAQYNLPLPTDIPTDPVFVVAESVRTLLSGDALQRSVAVHSLTDEVSYTDDPLARLWGVPFLIITMEDSYPAIRHFAYRGLQQLIADADQVDPRLGQTVAAIPPFDYLADRETRMAVVQQWQQWWEVLDKQNIPHPGPHVPLDDALLPISEVTHPLLAAQSQKIIHIGE